MKFLDEMTYQEWWDAQPWHFRLRHRVWWVSSTVWSVVRGRPGPGEHLLLEARRREDHKPLLLRIRNTAALALPMGDGARESALHHIIKRIDEEVR